MAVLRLLITVQLIVAGGISSGSLIESVAKTKGPDLSRDLNNLSEMPLSALLKVKKSISEIMSSEQNCETFQTTQANTSHRKKATLSTFHHFPELSQYPDAGDPDKVESRTFADFGLIDSGNRNEQLNLYAGGGGMTGAGNVVDEDDKNRKTYPISDGGDGWHEEKPSKVQKVFQLSITALAFLAFGGYLLCMIVQAIKSKGNQTIRHELQVLLHC